MAFRKVLVLALLGMAVGAPQQLHFVQQQNGFRSAPLASHSFVRAAPATQQQVFHTTSHASPVLQQVRTVAAPLTTVQHVSHVAQPTFVRQVNAVEHVEVEQVDNPNYSFGYSVADTRSGDSKTREEHAENGVVSGSYSVADPDGRIRTVEYTADAEHGFQAVVSYDGDVNAPPAIPFNAPAATTTVQASSPVQVIDARNNVATHAVHNIVQQQPTVVRTAAATHATHNFVQQPTIVRNVAQPVFHAAQPTFVRAAAQPVFHSAQPTFVRAAAQPTFVRAAAQPVFHTVSAQPTATHVSHANGVVSGFRTVSSPFATQLVHA